MRKTRNIFKKIGDIKVIFHANMIRIKDRKGKDLAEAEKIKERCQEYTELYKKGLNDPDNHEGVITHLEPYNHLLLCCPLLPLLSLFPSIRVFSNDSALCIRCPKHC